MVGFKTLKQLISPVWARIYIVFFDVVIASACMFVAIRVRYNFTEFETIPSNIDIIATLVFGLTCFGVWSVSQTSKAMWRFTSLTDIRAIIQSVIIASSLTAVVLFVFFDRAQDFPRSIPFVVGAIVIFCLVVSRLIVMFFKNGDLRSVFRVKDSNKSSAILIGSAVSLHNYINEIERAKTGPAYNIVGLIETKALQTTLSNRGRSIRGYPILGTLEELKNIYAGISNRYNNPPTLISTHSTANNLRSGSLVALAAELGAPLVRVSRSKPDQLTPFEASDLIGRKVKNLDMTPVKRLIKGKRVIVTGAGGSIGREIVKQVSQLSPEHLVLFDSSETNLYQVNRQMHEMYSQIDEPFWTPLLGDINNQSRLREVFSSERPQIVLHAAAIKHVHLSEMNPLEALQTNIIGTKNLLDIALEHRCESFTLISTDKAVDPTTFMGISKRVAELLVIIEGQDNPSMATSAVRFGNVLASAGSVIPLFEDQIAAGGPLTVTHKDVNRYFMTNEEASALVLQAAALDSAQKHFATNIYILEMGEPVKIAKLARQLIRLRGYVPDKQIEIKYTQLGKGEKITEDLTKKSEIIENTYVEGIRCVTDPTINLSAVRSIVSRIIKLTASRDINALIPLLSQLEPNFKPEIDHTPNTQDKLPTADIISLTGSKTAS